MEGLVVLDLDSLAERCQPYLTRNRVGSYVDAACVRLAAFHEPPTPFTIERQGASDPAELRWTLPGDDARASHDDPHEATEEGVHAPSRSRPS